jgi:hypothetical protein
VGNGPLQEATSETSRRIISEEVMRFIREGCGGEVRTQPALWWLWGVDSSRQPHGSDLCSVEV